MTDIVTYNQIENHDEISTLVLNDAIEFKDKIISNNDSASLKLFHINIRSVSKNFDEFLIYLSDLDISNIDIIILSETWLIRDTSNFNINNFICHYNNSKFNKNDGVLVYIKQNVTAEIKDVMLTETTIIQISCNLNKINVNITALYRPPSTNLERFLLDMNGYLENLNYSKTINVLVGDVNINLLDNDNQLVQQYLNTLAKFSYTSYINEPTRITETSSTIIDHLFIQGIDNVKSCMVTPAIIKSNITDHFAIFCKIKTNENIIKQNEIFKRQQLNKTLLIDMMKCENWQDVLKETDSESAYEIFINKLQSYINKCTKEIILKSRNKPIKPWITQSIINCIRKRDNMKKQLNSNYSNEKNSEYKNYRNTLTKVIRHTKDTYYKIKLSTDNSMKNTWNVIKEATNSNNKKINKIHLNIENKDISDCKDISNSFNDFFINIGQQLNKNIKPVKFKINSSLKTNKNSFFLKPITKNELIQCISTLKNNSAPGPDKINTMTLKLLNPYIIEPLQHIINLIFQTSIIPQDFKTSRVIPIHKQGLKTDRNNYRPITLINNLAKVFEKCLNVRLKDFLTKNKLLSDNQYGFREGLSAETAINEVTNIISKNLNNKNKIIAIFLDLAKAFDTVPHRILLEKLNKLGIRGLPLKLFENYLTNRLQATYVNNTLSDQKFINCGIPQGTVLGPTLFLIFVNDLCNIKIDGELISYADDTVIIIEDNTWDKAHRKASVNISKVKNWLDQNKLSLNINKTKFITFTATISDLPRVDMITIHDSESCITHDYTNNCICNTSISRVQNVRYLGIDLDQHLKWNHHINNLVKKLRKLIFKFNQIKNILNKNNLRLVYSSLAESVLRYGIVAWGGAYDNTLKQVEICQKLLLKIIFKKENQYPTTLLFQYAEVFNIRYLYYHSVFNFMYKATKTPITHNKKTRTETEQQIVTIKPTKTLIKRTFYYIGPKLYNMLPKQLRDCTDLHKYNKLTKIYLKENNIQEGIINKL